MDTTTSTRAKPNILRCLICFILGLFVIVGLVSLITYLAIRPAPIDYSLQDAHISDFNISSSNSLYASFDLTLQTTNHNKKTSIYYDSIELTVLHNDQLIVVSSIDPFHQPKHNVTTFKVRPVARGVPLTWKVAKQLKTERSKGEANWEVRVDARVRFKVGSIKSRHYSMKVDCDPVWVKFGNGRFSSVDCDVDI